MLRNYGLAKIPDGRVRVELKTPWKEGTRYLVLHPLDFIARPGALGSAAVGQPAERLACVGPGRDRRGPRREAEHRGRPRTRGAPTERSAFAPAALVRVRAGDQRPSPTPHQEGVTPITDHHGRPGIRVCAGRPRPPSRPPQQPASPHLSGRQGPGSRYNPPLEVPHGPLPCV
jgi:hypothetical protein